MAENLGCGIKVDLLRSGGKSRLILKIGSLWPRLSDRQEGVSQFCKMEAHPFAN
jgi:hypothetical protein